MRPDMLSPGASGKFEAHRLIRPEILAIEPYTPILPSEIVSERLGISPQAIIKLDANENPYGPSPRALEALAALGSATSIYPDPEARRLCAMLGDWLKVSPDQILVGAGADELIDLILRLLISPGDAVLNCPPTFGMYSFDSCLAGAKLVNVPRTRDFALDLEAIENAFAETQAKVLFIGSPNNPDGGTVQPRVLERLLELPILVVLDEAYIEFSGEDGSIALVPQRANLAVLRTFSKWAGLAGLRVGYGAFPRGLIEQLWKIKQPYNLNVAADATARASLADLPTLWSNVQNIIVERERLALELANIHYLQPYPSRGNFILCRVLGMEASLVKADLERRGILIRYYDQPGLRDHCRITVGKPEHTEALLAALRQIGGTT